jgi:hypothetical protein
MKKSHILTFWFVSLLVMVWSGTAVSGPKVAIVHGDAQTGVGSG